MADRRAAELGAPWWLQGLGGAALPGARWGEGLVYGLLVIIRPKLSDLRLYKVQNIVIHRNFF